MQIEAGSFVGNAFAGQRRITTGNSGETKRVEVWSANPDPQVGFVMNDAMSFPIDFDGNAYGVGTIVLSGADFLVDFSLYPGINAAGVTYYWTAWSE